MLAVESSLKLLNYDIIDFSNLYKPLKFEYSKLYVNDKSKFICNNNETRLEKPAFIQKYIDDLMEDENNKSKKLRCFIRPSGTEDVVRVYTEAEDIDLINNISINVQKLIEKHFSKNSVDK